MNSFFLPAATLWQRELIRFWRQKSRVLGVVASPLVFWLLIGSGSNDLGRFYSGSLVLTVMFSAIFSTISIIEDRREGFMLSMLVSPASRTSLVLGKILGSATLAWVQGLIFLAFAPLAGVRIGLMELPGIAAAIFLISFTLTGLGFVIAWKMNSTAGFHGFMNLLLLPMWMVSGALFPMATAQGWVRGLMWINPLTYAIGLLNHLLHMPNAAPGALQSLLVTLAFGLALLLASGMVAAQKATQERGMRLALLTAVSVLAACSGPKDLPVMGQVPQFSLTAESGEPFDSASLDGHIWVANFIFTQCTGPCPMMSRQMRQIQAQSNTVKLVSFSVDPANDTPPALSAYAKNFKPDFSRWRFLTGERERLNDLALNTFKLNSVDGSLNHSTRFVLVDRTRRIRRYYISTEDGFMTQVMHDIRQLEREKS